ncbi:hypothetical protein [Rariglobus hedericola]|uniref:VWA domain-containing protein n=1 Tax=Rariglobus hedericola TaxID=2597822 RepID=A0A556QSG4_9BACT|nr:hypothetical protein [Rariglobus hedericola]TSJ79572.1 hypothetical protein FPL22_09885 [Rariglobus hedericola]
MSHARPNPYRRITASVPLLVTVLVHVVLIAIAGYFVVSEQIIGKKKVMEAAAASEPSIAQKQVEHRLQVARKGGGSASSSPVSASRIFSTADNALQMPAMPDLPSVGASALSGMGFGSGMGAMGTGTGYNTGVGSGSGLGRGFMSMSFLGVTNQRASKVVFVVDISAGLMDIRKGGFRAFEILRTEISRLISTLPPSAQFNVVFFDDKNIRLFASELQPATVANKTTFFEWIKPINATLQTLGTRAIPASSPRWKYEPPERLKLDPDYHPSQWVNALNAALEQQPETVFLITGSSWPGRKDAVLSAADILKKQKEHEAHLADLKRQGLDLAAISAARGKAMAKLRTDFAAINAKLLQQKKDPFVIGDIRRVLAADFQAAVKKAGFTLKLDTTGWTDKAGNPIWTRLDGGKDDGDDSPVTSKEIQIGAEFTQVINQVSRLQYGLLRERASLNIFLFTGANEKTDAAEKDLSSLTSKNGGKFSLLTTKRLEELAAEKP